MQRQTLLGVAIAALIAAAAPAGAQPQPAPAPAANLAARPALAEARARVAARWAEIQATGFSGVVGVNLGDEAILRGASGFADPAAHRPFTTETQFEIGSLTKAFTAAAILKLQDEGKLKVSDPLSKFFPGIPADKAGITLHQLMTHSSGFTANTGGEADDLEPIGRDAMLARAFAQPLAGRPGEKLIYSNLGYGILAAVVETVSGEPYETYLNREILAPARTRHTGYGAALDVANSDRTPDGTDIRTCCWGAQGPFWNLLGNGGLVSTLDDFIAWRRAFALGRIVSPAAVTAAGTGWVPEDDGPGGEGYGWIIGASPTHGPAHLAAGGNAFFETYMVYYPAFDLTVLVHTNGKNAHIGFIASQLVHALFGEPQPAAPTVSPDAGSPQEKALLAGLGEALQTNDAAARRAWLDAHVGPVFRQTVGFEAIVARAEALHGRLAGSGPGEAAVLDQGAQIIFHPAGGAAVKVAIEFGGTPDAPRIAGFEAQ